MNLTIFWQKCYLLKTWNRHCNAYFKFWECSTSVKKLLNSASCTFISCCFRPVSNPLHLKFIRTPYRKKEKLWYSPLSCFVNQVQVWTFCFIDLITWFDWKSHHNEMNMWFPKGRHRKPGSYILDFVLAGQGAWIRKIWSGTVLRWYVAY